MVLGFLLVEAERRSDPQSDESWRAYRCRD
jgi:hypothetical protein